MNSVYVMSDRSGASTATAPAAIPTRHGFAYWSSQALPFGIILALLVAAFTFEPKLVGQAVSEKALGQRDRMYAMAVDAKQIAMAGTAGKVVRSLDGGASWKVAPTGQVSTLQALVDLGEGRLVAGGNAGKLLWSRDSGASWASGNVPAGDDLVKVMALSTQPGTANVWAVAHFGAVLKSTDAGRSWQRMTPKVDVIWNGIAFADSNIGWVVGEFGRSLRTRDGGETWQPFDTKVKGSLNAVAFADAARGVILGTEGLLLLTRDAGATWESVAVPTKEHLYALAFTADKWVAGGNKGALITGGFDAGAASALPAEGLGLRWITQVVPAGARLYITGEDSGFIENGRYRSFR